MEIVGRKIEKEHVKLHSLKPDRFTNVTQNFLSSPLSTKPQTHYSPLLLFPLKQTNQDSRPPHTPQNLNQTGSYKPKSLSILPSLYDDQPNPKIPQPTGPPPQRTFQNYSKKKYSTRTPAQPQPKPPNAPPKPLKQAQIEEKSPKAPPEGLERLQMEENDLDPPHKFFRDKKNETDIYYNPNFISKKIIERAVNIGKKSGAIGKLGVPSKRAIPYEKLQKKSGIQKENLDGKSLGAESLTLPSFAARKKSVKRPKKKAG